MNLFWNHFKGSLKQMETKNDVVRFGDGKERIAKQ